MSLKNIDTSSNDSAGTGLPCFKSLATDLKKRENTRSNKLILLLSAQGKLEMILTGPLGRKI